MLGGPSCSGGVSRDFALRGPQKAPSDQKGGRAAARAEASEARQASERARGRDLPGGRLRRALGGPSGARADLVVELVALEYGLGHLGDALAQVR
eukprot:14648609-Alexandrium_andersonii.AAC.1